MDDPKSSRSQVVLRRSRRLLDQLGPRRSARLSGIKVPQTTLLATRETRKASKCNRESTCKTSQCSPRRKFSVYYAGPCHMTLDGRSPFDLDPLRRTTRQANARYFWLAYRNVYKNISDGHLDIKEAKHIVVSDGITTDNIDKSHGINWVSVHGIHYICAVFKNHLPDMTRILDMVGKGTLRTYFGKYVLSHMEDLADSDKTAGKKPFAVVSVTRGSESIVEETCYKASGDELDEETAKMFLKGKMNRESALTKEETIETSIAGFHYLFKKKLKPEQFWVAVFRDTGSYDLNWNLSTNEIRKYLNDID